MNTDTRQPDQSDQPNQPDDVRRSVSDAYARAVTGKGGCCSSSATPKGATARLAGYEAELGAVPAEAAANSFGCGNPLAFSEVEAGQTVLDLGSGAGLDLLIAARTVGPEGRVIGVDMTDEMIQKAREHIAAAGHDNVEVRKGLIESLPVEDASVDWVISNCVINLSPEKDRVFAEIARALRPGGRFAISDIVVEELPAWARELASVYNSCVGGAISEADYVGGLRRAGLEQVQVKERFVYDAAQLGAIVASEELEELGLEPEELTRRLGDVVGKVWSAKFTGRKAAHS
jgi:SAM-dependent methyltransferase